MPTELAAQHPERHFVVLVSFEGKIGDPTVAPRCWVVPFPDLEPYLHMYGTRLDVLHSSIEKYGQQYENAWQLIAGETS